MKFNLDGTVIDISRQPDVTLPHPVFGNVGTWLNRDESVEQAKARIRKSIDREEARMAARKP